jgi:hypothetical protein
MVEMLSRPAEEIEREAETLADVVLAHFKISREQIRAEESGKLSKAFDAFRAACYAWCESGQDDALFGQMVDARLQFERELKVYRGITKVMLKDVTPKARRIMGSPTDRIPRSSSDTVIEKKPKTSEH